MTHIVPTAREAVMVFVERQQVFRCRDVTSLGYSLSRVRGVIQEFRKKGLCHVKRWERVGPKSMPQMVLIGGPGEDAPIIPVPVEVKRQKKAAATMRAYKKKKKKELLQWASVHRKTKYGLRSYMMDKVLEAMEDGKTFNVTMAAKLAGCTRNHMVGLMKRAKDAGYVCIYEWDTSKGGGAPIYGWRHIGMTDAPRPGKGTAKRKRQELRQTVQSWGWLYGSARV